MCLAFFQQSYSYSDGKLFLLAAGTDGQDGPTHVAGCITESGSMQRDKDGNLFARSVVDMESHNSYQFWFDHFKDWFVDTKGSTGTNVMDIYCMIKCFNE